MRYRIVGLVGWVQRFQCSVCGDCGNLLRVVRAWLVPQDFIYPEMDEDREVLSWLDGLADQGIAIEYTPAMIFWLRDTDPDDLDFVLL